MKLVHFLPMLDHDGTIVQLGLMINPHNVGYNNFFKLLNANLFFTFS